MKFIVLFLLDYLHNKKVFFLKAQAHRRSPNIERRMHFVHSCPSGSDWNSSRLTMGDLFSALKPALIAEVSGDEQKGPPPSSY